MLGRPVLLIAATAIALAAGCAAGGSPVAAPGSGTTAGRSADRILFGLGPEADSAGSAPLVRQAPVRMLTSWFNGPNDLAWMSEWRTSVVLPAYHKGFALHLVVWDGGPEGPLQTRYGPACGRAYALSDQFLTDMRALAQTFANGPRDALYVTLFAEFQTYPCRDNAWAPDPQTTAYYEALKDQYRAALAVFRAEAPNARVSLGWGGWQATWDDPSVGGGRSLFPHFADVMRLSDFQSFQSLDSPRAVQEAKAMSQALSPYGPVMLAFYKPFGSTPAARNARLSSFLSAANLAALHRRGLFALSFMDTSFLQNRATLKLVAAAVDRSGCARCRLP